MIPKDLWHNRMGRTSSEILSSLFQLLGIPSPRRNSVHDVCEACLHAKQSRTQFSVSGNKANDLFDLVHCDIWGPYRVSSSCGAHYFLNIIDDASRGV